MPSTCRDMHIWIAWRWSDTHMWSAWGWMDVYGNECMESLALGARACIRSAWLLRDMHLLSAWRWMDMHACHVWECMHESSGAGWMWSAWRYKDMHMWSAWRSLDMHDMYGDARMERLTLGGHACIWSAWRCKDRERLTLDGHAYHVYGDVFMKLLAPGAECTCLCGAPSAGWICMT